MLVGVADKPKLLVTVGVIVTLGVIVDVIL